MNEDITLTDFYNARIADGIHKRFRNEPDAIIAEEKSEYKMTVYEWVTSKDNVIINFNKYIDGDYIEILEIEMDMDYECSTITNSDHTFTSFPITATRTFYGSQVPDNDAAMLRILNQMYQDLKTMFNNIKYQNK